MITSPQGTASHHAPPIMSLAATLETLARAIAAHASTAPHGVPERFSLVEAACPATALEPLFDALPDHDAVYWATPSGEVVLGVDSAWSIRADGDDRFGQLQRAAAELPAWAQVFAGFSFHAGDRCTLGDARAILPRYTLRRSGEACSLSVALDRRDESVADVLTGLERIGAAMRAARPSAPLRELGLDEQPAEADAFVALVGKARAAITRGGLDKVVVHRQTRLPRTPRGATAALVALAGDQPTTTRFAFRAGHTTFLGATPERLVQRLGRSVLADVLAGSLPRGGAATPDALLASDKDRAEHELTRGAIVAALAPYCARLRQDGPHVRSLPHLHHLHTSVSGVLAADRHVLELVAALHPTPAVGGSPRAAALAFIAAEEPAPRGWYAAPVGWFRPDGDGDFAVALRCALLEPDATTLFAGAGIVAASDPARELAETASKRRAIAGALGFSIGRPDAGGAGDARDAQLAEAARDAG